MKKKIKVFTSNDLDGAGSLMFIKWAFEETCEIDFTISNIFILRRDYEEFCKSDGLEECSKIFILNMIPNFEVNDKVLVFSKTDGTINKTFKGEIGQETSTTGLISKLLKDKHENLSDQRKDFLNIIDKFYIDGGDKKDSMMLNAIFNHGRNKYSAFYDRFYDGIGEYSDEEKRIIKHYIDVLKWVFKKVELYEHHQKKGVYIALVNDMTYKHEILDLLFKKHSPKMIFLVDLDNGFVSVRKNDSLKMDMHKLCDSLIQGRALKNCAGGRYTEKFIDFSKSFM